MVVTFALLDHHLIQTITRSSRPHLIEFKILLYRNRMTFWLIIHFRFFHYQFFHYYSPKPSPARLVVRQAFIIIASEIPNHDIVRTRFVPLRTLRQQKKRHQKYGSDPIYHQQQSYTSHTSHHEESLRNAAFCGYRHGNHGEISRGRRSLLLTLEAMVLAWL